MNMTFTQWKSKLQRRIRQDFNGEKKILTKAVASLKDGKFCCAISAIAYADREPSLFVLGNAMEEYCHQYMMYAENFIIPEGCKKSVEGYGLAAFFEDENEAFIKNVKLLEDWLRDIEGFNFPKWFNANVYDLSF